MEKRQRINKMFVEDGLNGEDSDNDEEWTNERKNYNRARTSTKKLKKDVLLSSSQYLFSLYVFFFSSSSFQFNLFKLSYFSPSDIQRLKKTLFVAVFYLDF